MPKDNNSVTVDWGKYTVTGIETGYLKALRHGEPWQDLTGNKLVLALCQRIQALEVVEESYARLTQAIRDRQISDGSCCSAAVRSNLITIEGIGQNEN